MGALKDDRQNYIIEEISIISIIIPIIGENRCWRKCVNKTEGPKIVPVKHSKGFRLHLTEN
jgi:hypothetical protein